MRGYATGSEALAVLLNMASKNKAVLDDAIKNISKIKVSLDGISALQDEIKIRASSLPETVKTKSINLIDKVSKPEIPRLVKSVDDFKGSIDSLFRADNDVPSELRDQLKEASEIDLSNIDHVKLIPLNTASETTINIQEAKGREEGDRIHLHTVIYKMKKGAGENDFVADGNPVDEYNAYFELVKYGAYTSPGGGVVFVTKIKQMPGMAPINGQASPAVAWLLHYRPWPEDNESGYSAKINISIVGIGIHTVNLHFDTTKDIELGSGLTLTFFNDIIQLGYGRDLNSPDNLDYWYAGFKILNFGNGLGVK